MGIGSRSLLGLICGAIGGAVGWLITDFWANPLSDPNLMIHNLSPLRYWMWGGLIGCSIGAMLAVADALASGSRTLLWRLALRGALAGFLGGGIGLYSGGVLFRVLGGQADAPHLGFVGYIFNCLLRALGWTLAGIFLGAMYGLFQANLTKVRNGVVGGMLGGFIGGLVLDPLSKTLPVMMPFLSQSDRVARLLGFCLIGGLIGFFTALVNVLLKSAWVLVVYGRNEGREIILEKPVSHIGRSEMAEIPIYKDRLLAANHAEIRLKDGRYSLVDGGSVVGTSVNGQKLTAPLQLKDSDLIQVGNTQIVFYERATAGAVRRHVDLTQAAPAAPAMVKEGACPFCGEMKDPATGACACSVAGASGPASAPAAFLTVASPPVTSGGNLQSFPPDPLPLDASGLASSPMSFGLQDAPAGALRLVGTAGPHAGETFFLTGTQVDVGRDAANGIALVRDTTVSRKHARLSFSNNAWTVTDLGSSNGAFVNGVRVTTQILQPGDEVMFGTARLRVE